MSDKSSLRTKLCSEPLSIHCVLPFLTSKAKWAMQEVSYGTPVYGV